MAATQTWQPLERDALAARLAQDIPEGWSVNLGIGIPTLVGNYVPPEREVVFHSENGILGMGPAPAPDQVNRWLINASSQYVTLRAGASYMSHSDSFALVPGGRRQAHLDRHGTQHPLRRAAPVAPLHLPADRQGLRRARLHRAGGDRRVAEGLRRHRHGAGDDFRGIAGAHRGAAAPNIVVIARSEAISIRLSMLDARLLRSARNDDR